MTIDTPLVDVTVNAEVSVGDAVFVEQEVPLRTSLTLPIRTILLTQILHTNIPIQLESLNTLFTTINITKHPLLASINRVALTLEQEVPRETAEAV